MIPLMIGCEAGPSDLSAPGAVRAASSRVDSCMVAAEALTRGFDPAFTVDWGEYPGVEGWAVIRVYMFDMDADTIRSKYCGQALIADDVRWMYGWDLEEVPATRFEIGREWVEPWRSLLVMVHGSSNGENELGGVVVTLDLGAESNTITGSDLVPLVAEGLDTASN